VTPALVIMRTRLLFCLVMAAVCSSTALHAAEATDIHWRNFQHALGQPAAIGANAGHALAATAYRPIPALDARDVDVGKFRLGFQLFHDGRLSSGNSIACITCHAGPNSGVDGRKVSLGVGRAAGTLNALTTFNAAFNFRQFRDGRAITLQDQALEPIVNPAEMGNTLDAVLQFLGSDAGYPDRFASLYPDGTSISNMTDALAYFQHIAFTKFNTPFVRYLNGAENELGEQALRGWQRFDELGCVRCHNGINLGGNSYQQLGSAIPYYDEERVAALPDHGLMGRSGRDQDRHVFKVPGLHHVATTAPYFHDGSVATLEAAIAEMAMYQLGRQLGAQDIDDIAVFLRALSGQASDTGIAITALLGSDNSASQSTAIPAAEPSSSHPQAYLAAIAAIGTAQARLVTEMQRIHSEQVAHADFLQFQHLELIRHARALQYPPASLDENSRKQLSAQAELLLAAVMQLEWDIADFLRAQALSHVLVLQQMDPEPGPLAGRLGDITARLAQQQEIVRQRMAAIVASSINDLAIALEHTYPPP